MSGQSPPAFVVLLLCGLLCVPLLAQEPTPAVNPGSNPDYVVSVRVPPEVRNDIADAAVRFFVAAFPETPRDAIEQSFESWRAKDVWDVRPRRGSLPITILRTSIGEITLSFPEPRMWMLLRPRRGLLPGQVRRELDEKRAAVLAEEALLRLMPRAKERESLERDDYSVLDDTYCLRGYSTIHPDFRNEKSIGVDVSLTTGQVTRCFLHCQAVPPLQPSLLDKKILFEKAAPIYCGAIEPVFKLRLLHDLGRDMVCWEYGRPRADGASTVDAATCWDAYTGEIVTSQEVSSPVVAALMVRPDGTRQDLPGGYRNEKFFPPMDEKQIITRLEELAQARAEKLKADKAMPATPAEPAKDAAK